MLALLHSRRLLHRLVRTVLLLYGLTLGVAMASSIMNPEAMTLVCTSTGYKLITQNGGNDQDASKNTTHLLDCSMCLASGTLPVFPQQDVCPPQHVLSYALRSIPAARLASLVAAPLPARGPPIA